MPFPQPPLKYSVQPAGATSAIPQRWVWTMVRSRSIANARCRGGTSLSMWRKKRDCSRAVISEHPQQGITRWKRGMPPRCAARSTRAAPSRVATSPARRLLDHRTIGLSSPRSSGRSARERTPGWRR